MLPLYEAITKKLEAGRCAVSGDPGGASSVDGGAGALAAGVSGICGVGEWDVWGDDWRVAGQKSRGTL